MRKLVNLVLLLPIAVVLILLSVANRQIVRFSLDPLNFETPALSVELPFFVFLFVVLIVGMIIGGLIVWFGQSRHRKELRTKRSELEKMRRENETIKTQNRSGDKELAPRPACYILDSFTASLNEKTLLSFNGVSYFSDSIKI